MSSWVQWTARVVMLAAGLAAAGTWLPTTAFAQTGADPPGLVISGAGLGGGSQTMIPADVRGNAIGATGDLLGTSCQDRTAVWRGDGDVLLTRCAGQAREGHVFTWAIGSAVGGLSSRCVRMRGSDAAVSFGPFITDSLPYWPGHLGASASQAAGRPWRLVRLTGQAGEGDLPVQGLPWQVNQAGQGAPTGQFIVAWQEAQAGRTGESKTSGPVSLATPLAARLPLMAGLPLMASLPPLALLAGLSGAASAYGAGALPQAAFSSVYTGERSPAFFALAMGGLLAGASAVKLSGRRRRGVRGVRKGAMTL